MSSKSWLIDTKNSMLIVDEAAFPVNLGTTVREDSPEGSFRVIPFAGSNVLPTALGYRAFFSDSAVLDIPALPSDYCQHLIYFQTPTFITIAIALCEEGIYVCNVSNTGTHVWEQVVATGFNPASQVRHLATYAVVANKLCVYIQGMPRYYVVADIATIDNLVAQAPVIAGSDVDKVYNSATYSYAVASVLPTFINMAGQMGLFRADNRLGFWDSENAVAWSSATQLFDFTPSTETFAGITTFADVQGQIVKVMGHGDGFVIYASRSITLVSPVIGSPERFAGQGILSETGVSYDTQIAVAQPDAIHYALTSAGLVRISSGNPEFIHTEVSDYVVENSQVVALNMLDGRYLFITTTDDLKPSKVEVEVVQVVDHEDDGYFMLPTEEYSTGTPPTPVAHWDLNGSDPIAWNNFQYRDNTSGATADFRWFIDSAKLKLLSLSLGLTIYAFRVNNIMNLYYPVPSPSAPNKMQWKAELFVNMGAGESATLTYYVDGVKTIRTFTSADGAVTLQLTSPVITWPDVGEPISPNPQQEDSTVWNLLTISSPVYVDDSSIITLDKIYMDIPGDSNASPPGNTVAYMVQGKSSLVQDGFADFSVASVTDATFVKRNEVPLVPCYSGGDFKSSWTDGVDRVLRQEEVLLLFSPGIVIPVNMQFVYFQTPYTLTNLGPIYTDPTGIDRVRIIDQAGDDILATFADASDRMNQQLLDTANKILIDVPIVYDGNSSASVATPITPYPSRDSVPNIILNKDNTAQVNRVDRMMVPATGTVDLTECAINLNTMIRSVEFTSYVGGQLVLRNMYAVPWTIQYYSRARGTENIAVVALGPVQAFTVDGGGNWSTEGAWEFRSESLDGNFTGQFHAGKFDTIRNNPESRGIFADGSNPPTEGQIAGAAAEALAIFTDQTYWGYEFPVGVPGPAGGQLKIVTNPIPDGNLPASPVFAIANLKAKVGLGRADYDLSTFEWPASSGAWELDNVDYLGSRYAAEFDVSDATRVLTGSVTVQANVGHFDYTTREAPEAPQVYSARVAARYKKPGATPAEDEFHTITVQDLFTVFYNADNPVEYLPVGGSGDEDLQAIYAAIPPRPFLAFGSTAENIKPISGADYADRVSVRAEDWRLDGYQQLVDWEFVGTEEQKKHFSIEVSGYGYFPGVNENFRKTHTRYFSTSCPLPTDPSVSLPADIGDDVRGSFSPNYPNYSGGGVKPANPWPFPDPVPFPDTFALFRVGSWAPFYPTYKAAVFWDTQLNKWGRFNNEHKLVTTMMAVNREDAGIVPTIDLGLRGNSLREDGKLTVWSGDNKHGSIKYGRIGNYRLGWTTVTKVILRFASPAVCNVLVECSLDGASVDDTLTIGVTVDGLNQVEIPFTARVKWFNILIDGDFNLVGIQYESEARGRR